MEYQSYLEECQSWKVEYRSFQEGYWVCKNLLAESEFPLTASLRRGFATRQKKYAIRREEC